MKSYKKIFIISFLSISLLYLSLFLFSFSELFYYDDHYNPETEYLSWPHLSPSLKAAVVISEIIGFPFGFGLFFLNAFFLSLTVTSFWLLIKKLRGK